ncbi:MAG: DMT family transporter [Pseudomonadota bacterium]
MRLFNALSPNAKGIIATCLAMVGFIGTDSCIKFVSDDLPIGQMLVMRGMVILAILIALAFATGANKKLPTFKDKAVGARAIAECLASLLYYNAIIQVPIANANAVLQTIPLLIVAVAAFVYKEHVGWRRWLIILVGFSGVLLVVQPGSSGFQPPILFAVAAVIFFTMRDMSTRAIDPRLPAISINLVTSASVMFMGVILSAFQGWVMPSISSVLLLILAACFLTTGYLAVTVAMRSGDVSVSAPFRYSIVAWALIVDVLIFHNYPNTMMIIGMVIVVGSGVAMIVRERQVKRRAESKAG